MHHRLPLPFSGGEVWAKGIHPELPLKRVASAPLARRFAVGVTWSRLGQASGLLWENCHLSSTWGADRQRQALDVPTLGYFGHPLLFMVPDDHVVRESFWAKFMGMARPAKMACREPQTLLSTRQTLDNLLQLNLFKVLEHLDPYILFLQPKWSN